MKLMIAGDDLVNGSAIWVFFKHNEVLQQVQKAVSGEYTFYQYLKF